MTGCGSRPLVLCSGPASTAGEERNERLAEAFPRERDARKVFVGALGCPQEDCARYLVKAEGNAPTGFCCIQLCYKEAGIFSRPLFMGAYMPPVLRVVMTPPKALLIKRKNVR